MFGAIVLVIDELRYGPTPPVRAGHRRAQSWLERTRAVTGEFRARLVDRGANYRDGRDQQRACCSAYGWRDEPRPSEVYRAAREHVRGDDVRDCR
jgi:hypothetical protein